MENENNEQQTKQEEMSVIEKAEKAYIQLQEENKKLEANIKRMEELQAHRILGGKTDGRPQEVKPAEIDPRSYAKMVLSGQIKLK